MLTASAAQTFAPEEDVYLSTGGASGNQDNVREAAEFVREHRPELGETCATYRAAVVLLVAQIYGRGVHKLAKVTGYPSEFVARCARRLVDNGVWPDGQPYLSGMEVYDQDSFWQDVGVAEGRLCRRYDELGRLEWAPPGQWWKEFDFSVGNRNVNEGVVRYQPATVVPTSLLRDGMSEEVEVEVEEVEEPEVRVVQAARRPLPRPGLGSIAKPVLVGTGKVVVLGGGDDTRWLS